MNEIKTKPDKLAVFGAGLIGRTIAADLSTNYNVTCVDIQEHALSDIQATLGINTVQADLSIEDSVKEVAGEFDLIVGALPGFMGYDQVKWVIEAGRNIVDISFFPEDPFSLDRLAKENGVTAVVDCGLAPGLGNIILGYHNGRMNVESYRCYVGGLPVNREWPYEYKAVFSPIDVIEEYIRPSRIIRSGELITEEALTDPELVEFDHIGPLEAWNTDGLRTLIHTMKIPEMVEKTLRYPGSMNIIKTLRETGFFSKKELDINGQKIRPIDLTTKLVFPLWKLKPGEEDFTVMRIEIQGHERGSPCTYVYDLYDQFDTHTGTTSMARTTGYTCSAVVNLILNNQFTIKGICPPEIIGDDAENFHAVTQYLHQRGVRFQESQSGSGIDRISAFSLTK